MAIMALVILTLPLALLGLLFGDGFWAFLRDAISFLFEVLWDIIKFVFEGIGWIIGSMFD